jgi:hypothetical protein
MNMDLLRVVCTTCGNALEVDPLATSLQCDACGNTFLVEQGVEFASKSSTEHASIKKLRLNLQRAVDVDDHENILHFSKEILKLVPKDHLANYYYAYANYMFGSRMYLLDFYDDDTVFLPTELNDIVQHMMQYSDVRDRKGVERFILTHLPGELETFQRKYKQKLIDEENYSTIPRDVFVSFRSTDMEIAKKVVETIESDGYTVWISYRNLRPNDNDNYWSNISDAIDKANVFLVIASHDAMISRDVRKELDIAASKEKPRLEFKIDSKKHTSSFKYFFDGLKWIDASEDIGAALKELKVRVYDLLNKETEKHTEVVIKSSQEKMDGFTKLMNRSNIELLNSDFKDAYNSVKEALALRPNASEAWFNLFLAENKFSSVAKFKETISKNMVLKNMMKLYETASYQQYKKYVPFTNNQYPGTIKHFEEKLYKDMLDYLNKESLQSKIRTDFYETTCPSHILTKWASLLTSYEFENDNEVKKCLEDISCIKSLKEIFDDFDTIKNHPEYNYSHLKSYYDSFNKQFEEFIVQTSMNLESTNEVIKTCYETALIGFENEDYDEVKKAVTEVYKYDNTNPIKDFYLLLGTLKVNQSKDCYKAIKKLKKKNRIALFDSNLMQNLFIHPKTRPLVTDLYYHCFVEKVPKGKQLELDIRGDFYEM